MRVLACGSILFCVAFAIHLVWWRVSLPRRQPRALLVLFPAVFAAGLAAMRVAVPDWAPATAWEALHALFMFGALTLAYIGTYPALEADSPTMAMVMMLDAAGDQGVERSAFEAAFDASTLLVPRIRDLVRDGMADEDDGRLRLTMKGRVFVGILITHRRLMGMGKGG